MVKEYATIILNLKIYYLQLLIKLLLSFYNVKLFLIISPCNMVSII